MHDVRPEIYKYIYINIGKIRIIQQTREARSARQLYSQDLDFFFNDLECSLSKVCYILKKITKTRPKKHFKNEQRSRDAAA